MDNQLIFPKDTFRNAVGEPYTVLCYAGYNHVLIQFTATLAITTVSVMEVVTGSVIDTTPFFAIDTKATVFGVGYKGLLAGERLAETDILPYKRWVNMLRRCYDESSLQAHPTYRGCSVVTEWHNFQNFKQWFLDNYPNDGVSYALDKDIKVRGNKVYGPDTCMFVTPTANFVAAIAKEFIAISPEGVETIEKNAAAFSRTHNIPKGGIGRCINGKQKQTKGWQFRPLTNTEKGE